MSELLFAIAAVASAAASVLAWGAKIWWGKEYGKAKDAHIEQLRDQIRQLSDLTPMRIREYFESVKLQLEEYNTLLQNKLEETNRDLEVTRLELEQLKREGSDRDEERRRVEADRDRLELAAGVFQKEIKTLRAQIRQYSAPAPQSAPETWENFISFKAHLDQSLGERDHFDDYFRRIMELRRDMAIFTRFSSAFNSTMRASSGDDDEESTSTTEKP